MPRRDDESAPSFRVRDVRRSGRPGEQRSAAAWSKNIAGEYHAVCADSVARGKGVRARQRDATPGIPAERPRHTRTAVAPRRTHERRRPRRGAKAASLRALWGAPCTALPLLPKCNARTGRGRVPRVVGVSRRAMLPPSAGFGGLIHALSMAREPCREHGETGSWRNSESRQTDYETTAWSQDRSPGRAIR